MTAGMEGKTRHASSFSRCGATALTTCRAQLPVSEFSHPAVTQAGWAAHLIGQLLNENKGGDEDVRASDVLLELGEVLDVAELLKEVPDHLGIGRESFLVRIAKDGRPCDRERNPATISPHLEADVLLSLVQGQNGSGEGRLVLGLEHHVHDANLPGGGRAQQMLDDSLVTLRCGRGPLGLSATRPCR